MPQHARPRVDIAPTKQLRRVPTGSGGEAVVAGAAGGDGPDVDDGVVADDVVGVVPVHGGGRVTGHEGDRVAYPQRRALGGGEDAVLLVEPDRLQVMADDGDVFPGGDGLVAGVHDHPVALPADDAGLDGQRVLE